MAAFVSDEFPGTTLAGHWTVVDPVGDCTVSVAGGEAILDIPAGAHSQYGAGDDGLKIVQTVDDTDFVVTLKAAVGVAGSGDTHGWVIRDGADRITFGVYQSSGGLSRAYVHKVIAAALTVVAEVTVTKDSEAHMRVTRVGDLFTFDLSLDGSAWTTLITHTQVLVVSELAAFAGVGSGLYIAAFDWVHNDSAGGVVGTAAGVFGGLSGVVSGSVAHGGVGVGSFGGLSGSASGVVDRSGVAVGEFGGLAGSADGTVASGVSGSAAGSFGALDGVAAGVVGRSGVAAGVFGGLTGSAAGVVDRSGTGAGVFGGLAGAATGTVSGSVVGTGAGVFGALTGVADGVVDRSGTGSGSFGGLTGSATGAVSGAGTGTAAGSFGSLDGLVSGERGVSAVATGSFGPLDGVAVGVRGVTGTGSASFGSLTGTIVVADSGVTGTASGSFGALSGTLVGVRGVGGIGAGLFVLTGAVVVASTEISTRRFLHMPVTVDLGPAEIDLGVYRGDSWRLELNMVDEFGAVENVSGRTYVANVATLSDKAFLSMAVDTSAAAVGLIVLTMTSVQTATLKARMYQWDLEETDGSDVSTLFAGTVRPTENVA